MRIPDGSGGWIITQIQDSFNPGIPSSRQGGWGDSHWGLRLEKRPEPSRVEGRAGQAPAAGPQRSPAISGWRIDTSATRRIPPPRPRPLSHSPSSQSLGGCAAISLAQAVGAGRSCRLPRETGQGTGGSHQDGDRKFRPQHGRARRSLGKPVQDCVM